MSNLMPLIHNETIKMLKKRRFHVVVLLLLVLIPIFTYAQMKQAEQLRKTNGYADWRITAQQQVIDYTSRLGSSRISEHWKTIMKAEIIRLQQALDQNVNPQEPSGVTFTREFIKNAVGLFLPLMVIVMAADIVSSEHTTGTIKLLLTRPVSRWKVLCSKLIVLVMFVSLLIIVTTALSYLISGAVFGYDGWRTPVLTGFQMNGDTLDTSRVHMIEQWQYILMEMGLAWFSCLVVACLSLMVSVLVRSTAASMGIMLATLIAGMLLTNMVSAWESAKYLFMVHLSTVVYLSGSNPAMPDVTLSFSLLVLGSWAVASLMIGFTVFSRKDILN